MGPPIFVPLVGAETLVSAWRDAHPAPEPGPAPGDYVASRTGPARRPPRWWRQRHR
jgi:hypothetical protein